MIVTNQTRRNIGVHGSIDNHLQKSLFSRLNNKQVHTLRGRTIVSCDTFFLMEEIGVVLLDPIGVPHNSFSSNSSSLCSCDGLKLDERVITSLPPSNSPSHSSSASSVSSEEDEDWEDCDSDSDDEDLEEQDESVLHGEVDAEDADERSDGERL